tara:strand:+ start:4463 stop:5581 length:1119 start_codon:yes stop_codon:yes gene_type:complete
MKVLYLLNSNGVGGAEASIRRMVDRKFVQGKVALLWNHNNVQKNFWNGREVTQITDANSPLVGALKSIFAIPKYLKGQNFDAVQSQLKGADLIFAFLIFIGLIKKDFIYVVSLRNSYDFYYGNGFLNRLIGRVHKFFINKAADVIVGVSKQDIDRFTQAFGSKFKVIENSVDISNFKVKEKSLLTKNIKVVLVGNVKYRKGYDRLSSLIQYLNKSYPDYRFTFSIAGGIESEQFKTEVSSLAGGNSVIEFLGKVENINELLVSSDIFLSLSREEGLPISVLEGMAAKLPILLSNIPAHSLILDPTVSEYILFNNDKEMQETFSNLIESQTLREEIIQAQYKKLLKDFSLDRMCSEYLQSYKTGCTDETTASN